MKERMRIARQAILNVRKKDKMGKSYVGVAYGCVGLLDFIELNDPEKILDRSLKQEVKKLLKTSEVKKT